MPLSFAHPTRWGPSVRALDRAQFRGQHFVAADFVERDAAGVRLRGPAAFEFAITILGVLGQFFCNLRLVWEPAAVSPVAGESLLSSQACSTPVIRPIASTNAFQPCRWDARTFRPCAGQPVIAPPALAALLHPLALNPAALFQAVQQRVQGRRVKTERTFGSPLDQLADFVAVAWQGFQQREEQQLGAAFFSIRGR